MLATTKRGFALAIPAALLASVAILPLALVLAFGVCVPIDDEWDHLRQLVRLHEHQLRLADIFERYNEHRLVLPRLILFAMDSASGFDNRWAMRLSAVLVAVCIGLVSLSRLGPSKLRARDLWGFLPLALTLGDLRQLDGLLWGWAVQSYLCVAFAIAALVALGSGFRAKRIALSCLFSLCACASWAAGIAVFPALLAQWWISPDAPPGTAEREWHAPIALAASLACALLFLAWGVPHFGEPILLETRAANLFVFAGSALAGTPGAAMLEGTALLASAFVTLAALFGGQIRMRRQALGPGLLVFGIGSALLLAAGRASDDWRELLHPRYVCLLATIPAGLWITLLDLERAPLSRDLLAALLAVAISWGAIAGARTAFTLGPKRESERRMLAWRVQNFDQQTDARLVPLSSDVAAVREGSADLKRLRWNVWLHPIDHAPR